MSSIFTWNKDCEVYINWIEHQSVDIRGMNRDSYQDSCQGFHRGLSWTVCADMDEVYKDRDGHQTGRESGGIRAGQLVDLVHKRQHARQRS